MTKDVPLVSDVRAQVGNATVMSKPLIREHASGVNPEPRIRTMKLRKSNVARKFGHWSRPFLCLWQVPATSTLIRTSYGIWISTTTTLQYDSRITFKTHSGKGCFSKCAKLILLSFMLRSLWVRGIPRWHPVWFFCTLQKPLLVFEKVSLGRILTTQTAPTSN